MGLLLIPVTMQIVSRYTGVIPQYLWTEEIALFLFIWVVMLGSMIAVYEGTHFEVDLLPRPKSKRACAALDLVVNVCMIAMAAVFLVDGWKYAKFGGIQTSDIMGVNLMVIYLTVPLAGGTWLLFLLEKSYQNIIEIVRPSNDAI